MSRTVRVLAVLAAIVAVPAFACDAPVTAAVVKEILRVEGSRGEVVFVKQTRGTMRPLVEKVTTDYRSTLITEEILADFDARNAATAEPDLPNAIDLNDYTAAGGLDWARLERDFPGVNLVVQLSRPGCDSQAVFAIVQARYRHRNERLPDEGVLFQLAKQPDGTWKWERSAVAHAEHLAQ